MRRGGGCRAPGRCGLWLLSAFHSALPIQVQRAPEFPSTCHLPLSFYTISSLFASSLLPLGQQSSLGSKQCVHTIRYCLNRCSVVCPDLFLQVTGLTSETKDAPCDFLQGMFPLLTDFFLFLKDQKLFRLMVNPGLNILSLSSQMTKLLLFSSTKWQQQ